MTPQDTLYGPRGRLPARRSGGPTATLASRRHWRAVSTDTFGVSSPLLWIMIAAIAFVFALGGSSRADTMSLIVLRPAAMIFLGVALFLGGWETIRRQPMPAIALGTLLLLHLLHLVPLPAELWTALPGRERAIENLSAAQVPLGWRPLSLVPFATWNGLFALAVPIGFWLMCARFGTEKEQGRLVFAIVALAVLSAVLGALQTVSGYDSALYFYRITNSGLAVGLFANRNHNGYFLACAIPMMGYLAGRLQLAGGPARAILLFLSGLVLIVFAGIVLTGSRGALALFLVAVATLPLFVSLRAGGDGLRVRTVLWLAIAIALWLAAATFLLPNTALTRAGGANVVDELRFAIWPIIADQIWTYFPAGAGMGTFVEAYQIAEPNALLRSSYVNHAHNDWLELMLDGGLAGALLLVWGVVAWAFAMTRQFSGPTPSRDRGKLPLLGLVVIGMLGLGSILDYPLRTPSLAVLFALALSWSVSRSGRGQRTGSRTRNAENGRVNDWTERDVEKM